MMRLNPFYIRYINFSTRKDLEPTSYTPVICLLLLTVYLHVLYSSEYIFLNSHAIVMVFILSDKGIVYSARAYKIPESTRTATGTPLVQVQ